MAGEEKLESTFKLLVSLYQHVFYVPGNNELWTSKNECNSVDKFLRILGLAEIILLDFFALIF